MVKQYKTKIPFGMLSLLSLVFIIPVVFELFYNGVTEQFYVLSGIMIPTYAFVLHIFLMTDYRIEDNILEIKSGFLVHLKIDIAEIKEIRKTSSLMSSPAPSFDRIEIKYGKYDEVIISPKDKVTLAKDLTIINPAIKNYITEN